MNKYAVKRKVCVFIVIFVMVLSFLMTEERTMYFVQANENKMEAALQWAFAIANDNRHGYSMGYASGYPTDRWGPDYDCSSFVISALRAAGIDTGSASYTKNMKSNLTKRGFEWIPWSSINTIANLQRGDILLNEETHTEFYIGNNQTLGAHQSYGHKETGDQSGREISVIAFINHPWDGVLRYISNDICNCSSSYEGEYQVTANGGLNMRSRHSSNAGSAVITTIPKESIVYVSKGDGSWAHVTWNGYNGYCTMQYLKKIETHEAAPPNLRVWFSDSEMGDIPSSFNNLTSYYLCYELTDPETGKRYNEVSGRKSYSVKETLYKPDGTIANTCEYSDSDYNCLRLIPSDFGIYTGCVEISGGYQGTLSVTADIKERRLLAKAWISDSPMGDEVENCEFGKLYYLCYRIYDSDTGENTTMLTGQNYSVKETLINPDGTELCTYTYKNSPDNWIRHTFEQEGEYNGVIQLSLSGDDFELNAQAKVDHKFTKYVSDNNATVIKDGTKTAFCDNGCGRKDTIIDEGSKLDYDFNLYLGDLNRDGKIDSIDLSKVSQAVNDNNMLSEDEQRRADVNGDGIITKKDVEFIQQYIVGIITEFPAEKMLMEIIITKSPDKTVYYVGESLSTEGMQVVAVYGNNQRKEITDYEASIDTRKAGNSELVVAYMENGIIKSTSQKVTVNEKHQHSYESEIEKKATCSTDGKIIYRCSCGENYIEIIPSTGHINSIIKNVKSASCGQEGYTGDSYCKDCGMLLQNGKTIAKLSHDFAEPTFEWSMDGLSAQVVFICKKDTSHVEKKNATITSYVKQAATCGAKGITVYIATYNGVSERKEIADIPGTSHTVVVDPAVEATCITDGKTEGKHCARCNAILTEQTIIPAMGHTSVTDSAVAATCEMTGLTEGSHCAVCNSILKKQVKITAWGHNYNNNKPVFRWSEDGKECTISYVCSRCEKEDTHNCEIQSRIKVQPVCGKKGITLYTATYNGISEQKEIADIPGTSHTIVIDPAVAATCETTGLTEGSHCAVCHKVLKEQIKINEVGHLCKETRNFKYATYKSAGYTGDIYCKDCGKQLEKGTIIKQLKKKKQTIVISSKYKKKIEQKSALLKKKKIKYNLNAKAKGTLSYKVTSGSSRDISVSGKGVVTLKKGCRKGTYKITIFAEETRNGEYAKTSKVVTLKVK